MLRISKIHALITIGFVVAYLGLGLVLSPDFLFSDIQQKYQLAAYTVSATVRVWGPPSVPSVTLTPGCGNESSYILVDWESDENATSYDVFRNGEELVTGLAISSYQDDNVSDETGYSYYVVAHGPKGDGISEEASTVTNDCSTPLPNPIVSVTKLENFDLTGYSSVPEITDRKPEFSGTSNIANALVRIEVYSNPVIVATTHANANGYWSWKPGTNLSNGLHTVYITAIDPADPNRIDIASLTFRIKKEDEEDEDEDEDEETDTEATEPASGATGQAAADEAKQQPQTNEVESPGLKEQAPIDLALRISEIENIIVQGTDLNTQVYPGYTMTFEATVASFKGIKSNQAPIFVYSILDADGEEVYHVAEERHVQEGEIFSKKITLPRDLKPGRYKLRIEAIVDDFLVSEERYFAVEQSPVVAFQSNFKGLFMGFISDIGWLVIILILILILILIFAVVEWKIHHHNDMGMPGGLKKKGAH